MQAPSAEALGAKIAIYTSYLHIFISTDVGLPSSCYSKGLCELCSHLPVQFIMMWPHSWPLILFLLPLAWSPSRSHLFQSSASPAGLVSSLNRWKEWDWPSDFKPDKEGMNQGKIQGYEVSPEKKENDKPDKEDKETEAAEDGGERNQNQVTKVLCGGREEKHLKSIIGAVGPTMKNSTKSMSEMRWEFQPGQIWRGPCRNRLKSPPLRTLLSSPPPPEHMCLFVPYIQVCTQ